MRRWAERDGDKLHVGGLVLLIHPVESDDFRSICARYFQSSKLKKLFESFTRRIFVAGINIALAKMSAPCVSYYQRNKRDQDMSRKRRPGLCLVVSNLPIEPDRHTAQKTRRLIPSLPPNRPSHSQGPTKPRSVGQPASRRCLGLPPARPPGVAWGTNPTLPEPNPRRAGGRTGACLGGWPRKLNRVNTEPCFLF